MDCPKCAGQLQEARVEDETVDVCFVCEGVWFDRQELNAVIRKDAVNFKSIGLGGDRFDAKELSGEDVDLNHKRGKCPRCGEMMEQSAYRRNLLIDVCGKGDGVWLDGGEVHKLRRRWLVDFIGHLKFSFSEEGFRTFLGKLKGR